MATKTKSATDAIQILKDDHRRVLDLFKKFSEAGDGALKTKEKLAQQIFRELEIHTRMEEEIFYPAVREVSSGESYELVEEAEEEHHVVDLLIAELKEMQPGDEHFDAKMTVLCENVEHHIQEEEGEMLPNAKKCIGDQMDQLGEQMLQMKQQAEAAQ